MVGSVAYARHVRDAGHVRGPREQAGRSTRGPGRPADDGYGVPRVPD